MWPKTELAGAGVTPGATSCLPAQRPQTAVAPPRAIIESAHYDTYWHTVPATGPSSETVTMRDVNASNPGQVRPREDRLLLAGLDRETEPDS